MHAVHRSWSTAYEGQTLHVPQSDPSAGGTEAEPSANRLIPFAVLEYGKLYLPFVPIFYPPTRTWNNYVR